MTAPPDRAQWTAVDDYFSDVLVREDEGLVAARRESDAAGLPPIAVAPNQGKLLHLLARTAGARRVLEVGTLGGYSTIWLARAVPPPPEGCVVTLELEPRHAEVARANLDRAGVADRVEVRVGRAVDLLAGLLAEVRQGSAQPFDLVFVDADKQSNPEYFRSSVELTHPGSLIVVDNVVRNGAVADADTEDPGVLGTRRMHELVAAEPRVTATSVQTVGVKGYDGFMLALVGDGD